MLRKLYNVLVFVSRPFYALLASVRRLPLWMQLAILAFVIVVVAIVAFYFVAIHPTICPPENPQCGPWEKFKLWLHK